MPEQSLFNTNVFSIKSITVFLYFGTLDSVSSVGGHFKQQSYKEHRNWKKKKLKKIGRILEYSTRGENRKQSSSFFNLSWKEACWATLISFFHCSASSNNWEKKPQVLFWELQINEGVGEVANMESANNDVQQLNDVSLCQVQLSVQFSRSVMCSSLWHYGLQHDRLCCPSPTPKLMSIKSVMPSIHLILCHSLLLPPSIFPSTRVFSNDSILCIRWPKDRSFSFSIRPSNKYSGLISFRIDWLDLLAVQGTHENLLQHCSSKTSIL